MFCKASSGYFSIKSVVLCLGDCYSHHNFDSLSTYVGIKVGYYQCCPYETLSSTFTYTHNPCIQLGICTLTIWIQIKHQVEPMCTLSFVYPTGQLQIVIGLSITANLRKNGGSCTTCYHFLFFIHPIPKLLCHPEKISIFEASKCIFMLQFIPPVQQQGTF